MGNVLSDTKQQQILALGRLGWSLRRIETETGIRRETASRYLKDAGIPIRGPGRWGHASKPAKEAITDSAAKPAIDVITDSEPSRSPVASGCEPYRAQIEAALALGRTAMSIYQELVDEHGFERRYSSVSRFVKKLRADTPSEAHPVIITAPGEEGQVDYGTGPMVRDPKSGKYRRSRLFIFTLGFSRKSVRLLRFESSTTVWCELHEISFRRLGGTPRVVVLDNLREGVLTPDIYDPELNPVYRDMLAHYGVTALPCRVEHPNRKGKVESAINHTQTALRGLRFESLADAQAYLDRWDARWADTRIHGTTKRQVATMFSEEQPILQTLPVTPFRYYTHGRRRVHLDGCVEVASAFYGAPPGFVGRMVVVQWDESTVRLIDPKTGQLLRRHMRAQPGRHRIEPKDRPQKTPANTLHLLARANRVGPRCGDLARLIYAEQGQVGVRRILGLLGLAKKHGTAQTEDACALALETGAHSYRFVRRYLDRRKTTQPALTQIDPLIRELREYRDLIASMGKGEEG